MGNTLGAYDPIFYANETLIHLRKELGMAARVHLGYDEERRTFERGQKIQIRKPSTFTAQDAPSTAQDLKTEYVELSLDKWKEVKFALTDKELSFTGEQIIQDHIAPAAYALADDMDQSLAGLYKDIPWLVDYGSATDHTIIVDARKQLVDNKVPQRPGMIHMQVDSTLEAYFLKSQVFHSAQIAGQAAQDALLRGHLGTRFGVEVYQNQNTPTHTPGTVCQTAGDNAGAVNNASGYTKGATSMAVDGFTGSETLKAGDTFVIAGNTQRYAITADVAMSTGAATISFTPGLAADVADNAVVTFTKQTDTAHSQQLIYHRNAFAVAMAKLPDNLPGIEAFTVQDPVTGLAVRARRWAEGNNSKLYMAVDVLYGVKTLDPNLAARAWT
jgi:hypothetical protein